jgi:glucokinase
MSPSNLLEWSEFPIVDLLGDRFGVPVKLENDANAAAVGEYIYGAGRGHRNIFYLTVSTGIGGGLIIDGELYHGISTAAGEIGHTIIQPEGVLCNCGSRGCLETICSGVHIARRARERLEKGEASILSGMVTNAEFITARTVVDAVRQGDSLATAIWDETCHFLAIGIANAISLLAPEIVIVGGGVAAAGDLLFVQLRERVPHFVSMVPADKINIVPARLGTESGLYGAVAIARELVSPNSVPNYAA